MALLDSSTLSLDKEAWEQLAHFAFRPELFFDSWATVRPTNQTNPGSKVTFRKFTDLPVAATPLDEVTDVDPVTTSSSTVSVELKEYGHVVKDTRFHHAVAYIPLNPVVANLLGYNAGVSIDTVVSSVLHAGTNVRYGRAGTPKAEAANRGSITPSHMIDAHMVRVMKSLLTKANVPTFGGYYAASVHPDVSLDLREETGAASWRDPQVYGASQVQIWNGEIGIFEGFRFIESPRAGFLENSGAGSTKADVYQSLFAGQQALAKAVPVVPGFGDQPRIVPGPVTDHLRRFVPMGWYHVVGYTIFREESLWRLETGSSVDTGYSA